jgi:hypothetical protein
MTGTSYTPATGSIIIIIIIYIIIVAIIIIIIIIIKDMNLIALII